MPEYTDEEIFTLACKARDTGVGEMVSCEAMQLLPSGGASVNYTVEVTLDKEEVQTILNPAE